MHIVLAALSGALLLAAAEDPPQAASKPVETFLRAADVNDFAAMEAVMDRGSSDFIKKINNCYLRRVYSTPQGIFAAWMCSEGPDRSRVLIANVGLTAGNKVEVVVGREDVTNRPAPERAGSAFAP